TGHEIEGLQWLLELFTKLATGYFYLSRYQSEDALQILYAIPPTQRETPWVLAQIAKAFYQRHKYTEAEETFSKIKKLAPSRMEDMEVYSTVLWHLKRSIDLSYLAHTLVDADRYSPQAWCALGNSFSLQREHNQAIKCFQRATQLDPQFAYAWTLQGLEHIENEEFDKAQWSYRKAVGCDPRHYQAWYGLAQSFERLSKYEVAEKHYRSALAINPRNAILMVCIGAVLEKQHRPRPALRAYTSAVEADPRSKMARFKRAKVLVDLKKIPEAIVDLEALKDMAPDEALVHYQLARCYKMRRDRAGAIKHFTMAGNLDPKGMQHVKGHLEALDDDDYDDDDEF
ncbi:hypothetical protein LTS18_006844, partial [Coniosporium uncinatum]